LEQFLAGDLTSPSGQAIRNERISQLTGALAHLLEHERTAVLLKHFHDWPVAQIAQHMGRTEDGVAGLLRRGLKKLRGLLEE
jgi:RNA polymerase sigma-70 factor (ECF subfamily)